MKRYKMLYSAILLILLCGCLTARQAPSRVVLLPEERIFTIPSGQEIKVLLDKKEMTMTFPEDMKLVSSTTLVRQESRLNDALLNKVKANSDRKKLLGIIGSLLTALVFGLGLAFKAKPWSLFPKKITATVESK